MARSHYKRQRTSRVEGMILLCAGISVFGTQGCTPHSVRDRDNLEKSGHHLWVFVLSVFSENGSPSLPGWGSTAEFMPRGPVALATVVLTMRTTDPSSAKQMLFAEHLYLKQTYVESGLVEEKRSSELGSLGSCPASHTQRGGGTERLRAVWHELPLAL